MKPAVLVLALLAGPAFAKEYCPASANLYATYTSFIDLVLALSQSCEARPTTTCAEMLEAIQHAVGNMAKDDLVFLHGLKTRCED